MINNLPIQQTPPTQKPSLVTQIWSKIPPRAKELLLKFYSNKKIFIPITTAFSLVFLIIILGLLFGKRGPVGVISRPTPSLAPRALPTLAPESMLSQIQIQLARLKDQILSLDVNESKLQPPPINYDIKF